jgi:hypothetical protein
MFSSQLAWLAGGILFKRTNKELMFSSQLAWLAGELAFS